MLLFSEGKSQIGTYDQLTDNFAFSVQTIDDLFDRFNFEPSTPLFSYLETYYPAMQLDRREILLTLFNNSNQSLSRDDIRKFVEEVSSNQSIKLDFEQPGWFAVLNCKVVYKKKIRKLDLIMIAEKLTTKSNKPAFKWSIVSIKAPFIPVNDTITLADTLTDTIKVNKFLHPMSHAIDFMNIDEAFKKNMTRTYFAINAHSSDLNELIQMVNSGLIRFVHVESVSYHLLQLPGWILVVKFFDHKSRNSGWLIDKILIADIKIKESYLKRNLKIQ